MSVEYYEWLKTHKKEVDPYRVGRSFEYRVMQKLRKLGYYCVRKFGSKGHEDVVAIKNGTVLFIQCKWGRNHDTKPEQFDLQGLIELAEKYGGYAVFAGVRKHRMYFKVWSSGRWINARLD